MALMAEEITLGNRERLLEGDWLGTGITSNNNQSNSYVFRQRVIWAQAEPTTIGHHRGQLWSLATEDKKGISNISATS